MGSKLLISLVFVLLVGCGEPPLAFEENQPQITDAPIERDVVVYGTMEVRYSTNRQNSQYVCAADFDVVGWVEQDLNSTDVGCTGCSENYTLGPTLVTSDCSSLLARGAPTIAMMDFGFFPNDGSPERQSTYDFLTGDSTPTGANGPAEAFGRTNWNAVAFYDNNALDGFFGIYPPSDAARVPGAVEGTCVRESFLRATPATPVDNDTLARWSMNLCFTD